MPVSDYASTTASIREMPFTSRKKTSMRMQMRSEKITKKSRRSRTMKRAAKKKTQTMVKIRGESNH